MDLNNNPVAQNELKPLDKSNFIEAHKNISSLKYKNMLLSTAIVIIYSAAAVGSSTSLIFIPNLETITIFIFIVSYYYGFRIGLSMMLTTAIIFELFASITYGFGGPLFFFKIFGYTITVTIAAYLSKVRSSYSNPNEDSNLFLRNLGSRIGFMIIGVFLTLLFDLITTLYSYFLVQNLNAFVLIFISGLPFIFFHELTNGIIFFFVPDYLRIIDLSNNKVFGGFDK